AEDNWCKSQGCPLDGHGPGPWPRRGSQGRTATGVQIVPNCCASHPALWNHNSRDRLAAIDLRVGRLFALVGEGLASATAAFLEGDREAARAVAAADPVIVDPYQEAEDLAHEQRPRT